MMKQPSKKHLKNKHICYINKTPILFTAPHTKKLIRGGADYGEDVRTHKREVYTSFLACDFARATAKNSFLIWGVTNVIDETDIDPNYLLYKHFQTSPFHQCLHHWAFNNKTQPLFHVDIHGKMDRQHNCQIDVGIRSMEAHWQGDALIKNIRIFFEKEGNIFEGYKFGKFSCRFNTSPALHGYWGGDIHTMTEQAIILGIPSIQLQIPLSVRKKLFKDNSLRVKFQELIKRLYVTVIVPDFSENTRKYKLQKGIAQKFIPSIKTGKEFDEVHQQIVNFELKQEANPNNKTI